MLTVADLFRGPQPAGLERDPIEQLSACHRRAEQRLETLARAADRFHDPVSGALEAIDASLRFFETNGVRHTADEEESVFPRLLPRLTAEERSVIENLEREHETATLLHDELTRLAQQLRTDAAPPVAEFRDCVRRLTEHYGHHIAVEDTQVAGFARRYLTQDELHAVHLEMAKRRGIEGAVK